MIYGAGHFWRNTLSIPGIPSGSTLGPLIDKQFPGRLYTVVPIPGGIYPDTPKLESLIQGPKRPVLLSFKGTVFGALDANEFIGSQLHLPFRLFPDGLGIGDVADACVYHGETADTTVNPDPSVEADRAYGAEKDRRGRLRQHPQR